jgi:hypothetical protein
VDQSGNSVLCGKNIASQQLLRLFIVDLAGEPLALDRLRAAVLAGLVTLGGY